MTSFGTLERFFRCELGVGDVFEKKETGAKSELVPSTGNDLYDGALESAGRCDALFE